MGQEGIPDNAEARLSIAHQVLNAAVKAGMKEEDIFFDPLVMTVGADDRAAIVALNTIQQLRKEFPHNNITGGASNVSFGMPNRDTINASFLHHRRDFGDEHPHHRSHQQTTPGSDHARRCVPRLLTVKNAAIWHIYGKINLC
jgi:hypothetical protein